MDWKLCTAGWAIVKSGFPDSPPAAHHFDEVVDYRLGAGILGVFALGIVAVARKLLIALWRYIEQDQLPAGALLKA